MDIVRERGYFTLIIPRTDKFSGTSACRIVNYTHLGIQRHHFGPAILFSPHNKGFCFSMNNAVLVALFGHIAVAAEGGGGGLEGLEPPQ